MSLSASFLHQTCASLVREIGYGLLWDEEHGPSEELTRLLNDDPESLPERHRVLLEAALGIWEGQGGPGTKDLLGKLSDGDLDLLRGFAVGV